MKRRRLNCCYCMLCTVGCLWLLNLLFTVEVHLNEPIRDLLRLQSVSIELDHTGLFKPLPIPRDIPKTLRKFKMSFLNYASAQALPQSIFLPPELSNFSDYYNKSHGKDRDVLSCGVPRQYKSYLTIGIPTMKRRFNNFYYLNQTLHELVKHLDEDQYKDVVVVIQLADNETEWNDETSQDICSEFQEHFDSGLFQLITVPHQIYPNFSALVKTKQDNLERVKWRSKQNIDFAFLMLYCFPFSTYYMQLEDDVMVAPDFLHEIRKFIKNRNTYWVCLEFSELGFIGKLFHSSDLLAIAVGLSENFSLNPCDLLLGGIRTLMGQPKPIHTNVSLFQHIGKVSTLNNKFMPVVDRTFKGFGSRINPMMRIPKGHKPPARFNTDMDILLKYPPENVYLNNSYFRTRPVRKKQYFQIIFKESLNISRIILSTGNIYNRTEILENGVLNIGADKKESNSCKHTTKKATFVDGEIDTLIQGVYIPSFVNCLEIQVVRSQKSWLIIRNIELFLK